MKPRTFGEIFGQAAPMLGGAFLVFIWVFDQPHGEKEQFATFVSALFFGVVMGLVAAYFYQGETVVKACDDTQKTLAMLAVRLAENRYNLETQTESLHTFKPPFDRFLGGRIYIILDGPTLRIVGPTYVLKKLRDNQETQKGTTSL